MDKPSFTYQDLSNYIRSSDKYSNNHMTEHLADLERRKEILNQNSIVGPQKMKFERFDSVFNKTKGTYINIEGDFSTEDRLMMMIRIMQLNEDMISLEESMKGRSDADE